MNRHDLQQLSQARVRDARVLLDGGRFAGSYYLMGYAVECAIKSAIARQTNRYDFPNKELAQASFTHNLQGLLKTAGLWSTFDASLKANAALDSNWAVVKDWSEHLRYEMGISEAQARDFYSACTARSYGLLSWLKKYW